MNPYFYRLQRYNRRDEPIAVVVGIVFAENTEDAENRAWAKSGSDSSAGLEIFPVPEEGLDYFIPVQRHE